MTTDWRTIMMYPIPSIIYLFHNNVQFYTMAYVDAATYQILGNLKIVTTGRAGGIPPHTMLLPHTRRAKLVPTFSVSAAVVPTFSSAQLSPSACTTLYKLGKPLNIHISLKVRSSCRICQALHVK